MAKKKQRKKIQASTEDDDSQLEQIANENNVLPFFGTKVAPIASDLFVTIMLYIPVYPYIFSYRKVSKNWKAFIEQRVYNLVTEIHLTMRLENMWRTAENMGFKERYGKKSVRNYEAAVDFLAHVLPNVKKASIVMPNANSMIVPSRLKCTHVTGICNWEPFGWNEMQVLHFDTCEYYFITLLFPESFPFFENCTLYYASMSDAIYEEIVSKYPSITLIGRMSFDLQNAFKIVKIAHGTIYSIV